MDEAQIRAVMAKIKAAKWNRQLIDADLVGIVRSPEMIEALFEQLEAEDYQPYSDAGFALAEIAGESAKGRLIDALSSERWQVRAAAVEALGHYKDFQLTHYLIPLLNDPSQPVRIAVAETLEGLRDQSAVPSLIEAVKDINRHVSVYATYALYEIAVEHEIPELFPYLKSDDPHLRLVAAYVLGAKGGKDAVRGLIDLVRVGMSGDKTEFERALEQLLLIDEPPVDYLMEVFDERDSSLCELVTPVLVKSSDQRVLPHLVAAFDDPDDQVREVAVWGASQFGKMAIPLLAQALKSDNYMLRSNVIEALGHIQDASVVDDLVGLLKDSNAEVQQAVLMSLEKIGDVRVVEHIIPLLNGATLDTKGWRTTASYAAQVLRGKLATPEGLEAVERWKKAEGGNGA